MALKRYTSAALAAALLALWPSLSMAAPLKSNPAQTLMLTQQPPDPDASPRPAPNSTNVPLRTSIYFEVGTPVGDSTVHLLLDSVTVSIQPSGGQAVALLEPGRHFVNGASGWLRPGRISSEHPKRVESLHVYIEPGPALKPHTKYTIHVSAHADASTQPLNHDLPATAGTWSFTTADAPGVQPVTFPLDLASQPLLWHGQFWSGFCNIVFCTDAATYAPTYELMAQARRDHPRAWTNQRRDFWLMGTDDGGRLLPNLVRERETRHVKAIQTVGKHVLLHVEDFFGHEQYAIPSDRPLSQDYHRGNQVVVADLYYSAGARVLSVDDQAHTVLLGQLATPPGGWHFDYAKPLPTKEDPDAPGLFATAGCYLHKLRPHGTACYYWGRLDKEWDLAVRRYHRRVEPNFTSPPADLSVDGREFNTCKDFAQWHEVARTIAGHIIDRYGPDSLHFTWSVFNEPEVFFLFWRNGSWIDLQRFYDYTADAILRAFEDRGYDSRQVFIGGLELGGVYNSDQQLNAFLAHCSPSPQSSSTGALPYNAAFANPALDGQRSRRVEELCRAHQGRGSPCDFISKHIYHRADIAAASLTKVKEQALAIDPDYYRNLWVNSHEACPNWLPMTDDAANDSYLGDGYFPSWCMDIVGRQLRQAAADPRYAFGETIITTWGPVQGMRGLNSLTRILPCDDHATGKADRQVTIPYPVFNALNLLSDMGDHYWVLPTQQAGAHLVSGFASRDDHGVLRVVLCAHDVEDTQSRSDAAFDVTLNLNHPGWSGPAKVVEYRFDRDHNTYYPQAVALRTRSTFTPAEVAMLQKLAQCRSTGSYTLPRQADANLTLTARVAGNGVNFLVIAPATNSAP